jgi:actin-like protein 6A
MVIKPLIPLSQGVHALKAIDGTDAVSISQMVLESINKCDVDVRKELCNAVLLTGGTSLLPQVGSWHMTKKNA